MANQYGLKLQGDMYTWNGIPVLESYERAFQFAQRESEKTCSENLEKLVIKSTKLQMRVWGQIKTFFESYPNTNYFPWAQKNLEKVVPFLHSKLGKNSFVDRRDFLYDKLAYYAEKEDFNDFWDFSQNYPYLSGMSRGGNRCAWLPGLYSDYRELVSFIHEEFIPAGVPVDETDTLFCYGIKSYADYVKSLGLSRYLRQKLVNKEEELFGNEEALYCPEEEIGESLKKVDDFGAVVVPNPPERMSVLGAPHKRVKIPKFLSTHKGSAHNLISQRQFTQDQYDRFVSLIGYAFDLYRRNEKKCKERITNEICKGLESAANTPCVLKYNDKVDREKLFIPQTT